MTILIAETASGPIMWLTITASVVTASCPANDVIIEAARKFLNALDVIYSFLLSINRTFECAKLMIFTRESPVGVVFF